MSFSQSSSMLERDIMSKSCSIHQRKNGTWHLRIVVPTRLRAAFEKTEFHFSLRTKSRDEAYVVAAPRLALWRAKFTEAESSCDPNKLSHLKRISKAHGLEYIASDKLAEMSNREVVSLMAATLAAFEEYKLPSIAVVNALGGKAKDAMTLDEMFDRFQQLASAKWADLDKRARQKKWRRYQEPIEDFKNAIGDLDVLSITTAQAHDYAINLGRRVEAKKLKSETAKKKLMFLSAMVERVFNAQYPERRNPFENAKIDYEGDGETRKPFTENEVVAVREAIAASDANEELKAICTVLECTGTHAKEITLIHESDIFLDLPVPFIRIGSNPNRLKLKTGGARHREVPLQPRAVEALRPFEKTGFPRYCRPNGSEAFSAAANKLIQAVAPEKTTYSWRHLLADRLRDVDGVEDSLIRSILGHNGDVTDGYGKGYTIKKKMAALTKAIAEAEASKGGKEN